MLHGCPVQPRAGLSIDVLCRQDGLQVTGFLARRSAMEFVEWWGHSNEKWTLPAWEIVWLQKLQAIFRCFPARLDSACLSHCSAWNRPQYMESIAVGVVTDHLGLLLQVSPAIPEIKSRILEAAISKTRIFWMPLRCRDSFKALRPAHTCFGLSWQSRRNEAETWKYLKAAERFTFEGGNSQALNTQKHLDLSDLQQSGRRYPSSGRSWPVSFGDPLNLPRIQGSKDQLL